jgi:flagellar assembly protein FliH
MAELAERMGRSVMPLEFGGVDDLPAPEHVVPEDEATFSVSERARQVIAMVNSARDETARTVREECSQSFEAMLAAERGRVEAFCAELARDRREYFAAVERRVVELAIAIARKVLAREVALDSMHLTAIVKAALDRVQDESVSKLRVPVSTAADWRAMFARGNVRVEVVSDDRLPGGTVRLETSVGQVELGVAAQLEEVERGFAALMGA